MLARLRVWLRLLAVAAVVALTSFSTVTAPVAHAVEADWVKDFHRIMPKPSDAAKAAGKVGTRTVAPRLALGAAVCSTGVGCLLLAGGTVAASMYLSSDAATRHGEQLAGLLGVDGFFNFRPATNNTYCTGTVNPVAWSQHGFVVEYSLSGNGPPTGYPGQFQPCGDAFAAGKFHVATLNADCVTADGVFYSVTGGVIRENNPGGARTVCANASTDWLIGLSIPANNVVNMYKLSNPAYYKNPTWSGVPGADSDWWNGPDSPVAPSVRSTVECMRDNGTTFTLTATLAGLDSEPALGCGPDASPIRKYADIMRGGAPAERLYDVSATPEARADYPLCFSGAGCEMGVTIDGLLCEYGAAGCAGWWELSVTNPDRVSCVMGPYVLGPEDCRELRHAYETPDGVWYPPEYGTPAVPFPPPVYVNDPTYRPPPGAGGADPSWLTGSTCPPVPIPGVSTYGLQPVALNALHCFMPSHSDFSLTSGYRDPAHSESYSDHPYGLAVDLGVPNWDTPAGNQRGWDAVAYWLWNAPRLGVDYVIYDGAIWWPATGWHTYTGPSPHRDHIHVSFTSLSAPPSDRLAPVPAPTTPYPQPTPSPDPAPPTNPQPNPPTNPQPPGTDPEAPAPTFPETGTSPTDPDGCLATSWTWDPVSWVAAPVKCSLLWAFVPKPETVTQVQADVADGVGGTGVTAWADVVGTIPDALDADESAASCLGPGMAFPEPIGTVYVLDACSGIRATLAAACKTIAGASIAVGAVLSCLSLVSRALGYDTALSTITAPLAAPGPGDTAASSSAAVSGGPPAGADVIASRAFAKGFTSGRNFGKS